MRGYRTDRIIIKVLHVRVHDLPGDVNVQTSAVLIFSELNDLSGVTFQSCFLTSFGCDEFHLKQRWRDDELGAGRRLDASQLAVDRGAEEIDGHNDDRG